MHRIAFILPTILLAAAPAFAQFKEGEPGGAKTGPAQTHRWKAGVVIQATAGPCRAVSAYVPVPMEWPEQTVKVVDQDVSPGVKLSYQTLNESAKLLMIKIPWVAAGEQAKAVLTFECNRSMQLPPEDKAAYVLPVVKGLEPALRRYLGASPFIETQDAAIRKAAKENGAGAKRAWDRVEALYDLRGQRCNTIAASSPPTSEGRAPPPRCESARRITTTFPRCSWPSAATPTSPPDSSGSRSSATPSFILWTKRAKAIGSPARRPGRRPSAKCRTRSSFWPRATTSNRRTFASGSAYIMPLLHGEGRLGPPQWVHEQVN